MDLTTIVSGLMEGYQRLQETHPVMGAILTTEIIFPLSDGISQIIKDKHVDWKKVRYTAALAPIYGIMAYAAQQSGEWVGDQVYNHPLAKAALGPNLWGNVSNIFFFVNNTLGERNGYSIERLVEHYRSLLMNPEKKKSWWENAKENVWGNVPQQEYRNSVVGTITIWNVFQYCNYSYIEEAMRTPASIAASLIWMPLMSLWSLSGRRKIVMEEKRYNLPPPENE